MTIAALSALLACIVQDPSIDQVSSPARPGEPLGVHYSGSLASPSARFEGSDKKTAIGTLVNVSDDHRIVIIVPDLPGGPTSLSLFDAAHETAKVALTPPDKAAAELALEIRETGLSPESCSILVTLPSDEKSHILDIFALNPTTRVNGGAWQRIVTSSGKANNVSVQVSSIGGVPASLVIRDVESGATRRTMARSFLPTPARPSPIFFYSKGGLVPTSFSLSVHGSMGHKVPVDERMTIICDQGFGTTPGTATFDRIEALPGFGVSGSLNLDFAEIYIEATKGGAVAKGDIPPTDVFFPRFKITGELTSLGFGLERPLVRAARDWFEADLQCGLGVHFYNLQWNNPHNDHEGATFSPFHVNETRPLVIEAKLPVRFAVHLSDGVSWSTSVNPTYRFLDLKGFFLSADTGLEFRF